MASPREITIKIYEAVEEGLLDAEFVMTCCLKYMSEDDVADMAHINEFFLYEDEDEDEEDEDDDEDQ